MLITKEQLLKHRLIRKKEARVIDKKAYRKKAITFLTSMVGSNEKKQREYQLQEALLDSESFKNAQTIGAFIPGEIEHSLDLFFAEAFEKGKVLVLPKAKNKVMTFHLYQKDTLLSYSSFGVLEPQASPEVLKSEIDFLIVPGLLYNENHFRIGFGGGYYDRYLKEFKGQTVSLLFKEQMVSFTPESHDIPIQQLIVR